VGGNIEETLAAVKKERDHLHSTLTVKKKVGGRKPNARKDMDRDHHQYTVVHDDSARIATGQGVCFGVWSVRADGCFTVDP